MKRNSRMIRRSRKLELVLEELVLRSVIIMLLGFVTVLLVTRPWWAVKAVRLLIDAATGVGTYL